MQRTTMRRAVVAVLLAASLSACAARPPASETVAGRPVTGEAIARVNAFRTENGLPALAPDPRAERAALDQARTMAASRLMEHNIGFGANFAKRMKGEGVPLPAAENIASGQETVSGALAAWEKSPPHRANTLSPAFTGVGLAVAYDEGSDPGRRRPYWAMVLTGGR